jgi:hypothetical protein
MPEARFAFDGTEIAADAKGVARISVPRSHAQHRLDLLTLRIDRPEGTAEFARWRSRGDTDQGYAPTLTGLVVNHTVRLQVAFEVHRNVRYSFVDQARTPVSPERITAMTLRSDTGQTEVVRGGGAVELMSLRPSNGSGRLVAKQSVYSVQSVEIDGANVVNIGEQRFRPSQVDQLEVVVLLRSVRLRVQDRFFGSPIDAVVNLTYPDGRTEALPTGPTGEVALESLARGTYVVNVPDRGVSVPLQVALSRSQFVDVPVLSHLDLWLLGGGGLLSVLTVLLLGWWRARSFRAEEATHG